MKYKKLLTTRLSVGAIRITMLLAYLLSTIPAFAETVDVTVDDIKYTVDLNPNKWTAKNATVVRQSASLSKENLVIPDYITYNGDRYWVMAIEHHAFSGCSSLTGSLTIGNYVTTIET